MITENVAHELVVIGLNLRARGALVEGEARLRNWRYTRSELDRIIAEAERGLRLLDEAGE